MIRISKLFVISLLMMLVVSCSSTKTTENKSSLINSKTFISERKEGIERSVALGPRIAVDLELDKKIRNNERRQINKEERKNYINISDTNNNVFPITINFENVQVKIF